MPDHSDPPWPGAALAADLGGTTLTCGVVERSGRVVARTRRPSLADRPPGEIVANLLDGLEGTLAASGLDVSALTGAGMGAPGIIYPDRGVLHRATNFPTLRDLPLARIVSEHFGLPARLRHDVDTALLAERRLGAARGADNVICLTVGTGIGMGLMLNGRLYTGGRSGAGNLGHLILDAEADPAECAGQGYLEARASGPAVRAAAIEAVRGDRATSLRARCGDDPESAEATTVFEAARGGDEVSVEIVGRAAHLLGVAIANLVNLLDPDIVVVGGGVAQAGEALFVPLTTAARQYVCTFLRDRLNIAPAQLGTEAGLIGSGLAVWED